jgi:hypothetical protein
MPINTNFGTMSIGRDVAIDAVLGNGQVLRLGNVTMFDAKPRIKKLNSLGIDGINRTGVIPEGWDLRLEVDRQDRTIDDWWAQYEADYYAGRTVQSITVIETIDEPDGTVSVWRYEGCSFHFEDAGAWKSDSYVKMKLAGEAARKIRVQ